VLAFLAGDALQQAASSLGDGDTAGALVHLQERREVLEAAADLWRDDALRQDATMLSRYERILASAWQGWPDDDRRTLVVAMNWFGDRRMR
jgi:hypothetical protein